MSPKLNVQTVKGNVARERQRKLTHFSSLHFIDFNINLQVFEMHAAKKEHKKNPRKANKENQIG